nr:hypothetical protein [Tanacetum cinerariifolium]
MGKGLFGPNGERGGKVEVGFDNFVELEEIGNYGGSGGRGSSIFRRVGVRAGKGEVKGGGVDLGVTKSLLGETLGESGDEEFGVDGGADKLSLESYKAKCEKIKKVLSDSEASSSSFDDKIAEVSYYTSESESESEYETSDYYDNSTTYGLDNNDDQEIFHDSSEKFSENLIESQIDHNESDVTHNDSEDVAKKQIDDQEILFDKMSHLDTFSSVRRPKHIGIIWKKKWSSNTSNIDLSSISHLKVNKDVKRYSRKDLLSYLDTFSSVRRPKHRGNEYVKNGQNQSKTDKTGHGNEKSSRNQSRRRIHLKFNPVNPLS